MRFRFAALTGTLVSIAGIPATLVAQTAPPPIPTREEIDRTPVAPVAKEPGQRVSDESNIERAPCPLDSASFKDITIKLDKVDFGDLQGINPELLRPAYQRYIGQTIPIASVCAIRDQAATILRNKGYIAAVQVPPQKIEGGIVKFDVLLAKLVNFQVRGDVGKSSALITRYLNAIKDQPIFNVLEAERYLLLARDIPGYDVRLTLRPAGSAPGEVIGDVQVTYVPVEVNANFQNYGSKAVGRIGGITQVQLNGLIGAGDRTTIGFYANADFKEQLVGQLAEEVRVGRNGLTFAAALTYAVTKPTLSTASTLTSKTLIGNLSALYPVLRKQTANVNVSFGLDGINQRTRSAGALIANDQLHILYGRAEFDAIDPGSVSGSSQYSFSEPRWRVTGTLEVRQGVGALGASLTCGTTRRCPSRAEGDATAFVTRVSGYAEFRPLRILAFSLAPRAQYSKKPLLSFEEFSTGNYTVGRGYDPGTLTGDSGVGASAEIKVGSLVPKTPKSVTLQGYAFGDAAAVWNRDSDLRAFNPQKLYSAGAGVRIGYGQRGNLDIGAAVPLKRAGLQDRRENVRILANLTLRLIPWNRR